MKRQPIWLYDTWLMPNSHAYELFEEVKKASGEAKTDLTKKLSLHMKELSLKGNTLGDVPFKK